MKPTAVFINIGRGLTTRLDDLVAAIEGGEIAGCALDVFEVEPLPENHKLWTLPNVLLTPHIAAKDAENIPERQFEILIDNARRFADDRPLQNIVDKSVWYWRRIPRVSRSAQDFAYEERTLSPAPSFLIRSMRG